MNAKPFLDTNVLIYAFAADDRRSPKAEELIAWGGTVSVQVLNEFANVSVRKLLRSWEDVEAALGVFRRLLDPPIPLTVAVHEEAIALARDHRFSFYDALIIAAARQAGCRLLLTEDMADGATIDGLTIRNPFKTG
jgi:predicted nucleic acid-binding protein